MESHTLPIEIGRIAVCDEERQREGMRIQLSDFPVNRLSGWQISGYPMRDIDGIAERWVDDASPPSR